MYGIASLIAPENPRDFMNCRWGETALHISGQPKRFVGLFSSREINGYLRHGTLAFPNVGLVLDQQGIPTSIISQAEIDAWRRKGATLILTGIQRWHPKISKFVSVLHRDINRYIQASRVQVNCYASMPAHQGFDCHYDFYDVFIVQIEGKKSWKLFNPTIKRMMTRDKTLTPPDEKPYLECVLSEGDVLYIPQGHWHAAVAAEESIHLTVGVHVRTGIDFIKWLADELIHDPTGGELFRKHLPAISDDANGALKSQIRQLEDSAVEYIRNKDLAEKFSAACGTRIDAEMNHLHRKISDQGTTAATNPLVEKGRRAEKETIARSLLEKGLELSFIADVTGLQHEELQALRKPARTDE